MQEKEKEEEGFRRLSDKKLLRGLIIFMLLAIYGFIFLKIVFLK